MHRDDLKATGTGSQLIRKSYTMFHDTWVFCTCKCPEITLLKKARNDMSFALAPWVFLLWKLLETLALEAMWLLGWAFAYAHRSGCSSLFFTIPTTWENKCLWGVWRSLQKQPPVIRKTLLLQISLEVSCMIPTTLQHWRISSEPSISLTLKNESQIGEHVMW